MFRQTNAARSALLPAVVACSMIVVQAASAQTTRPGGDAAAFDALAKLNGTWTLDGKWANGNPFKGRQTIDTILGGKFVTVRTWSASGDAAEAERDFVVYGLDESRRLTQWVYLPDGTARQTAATRTDDGSIQFDWTKTDAKGKATELRTVLNVIDADTYRWRTQMHIKGEWHTLIDGEWKKQK